MKWGFFHLVMSQALKKIEILEMESTVIELKKIQSWEKRKEIQELVEAYVVEVQWKWGQAGDVEGGKDYVRSYVCQVI